MKSPAFQFYVKDWTSNQKLRRCSEAARGAWIDILCLLHDSEEYGVARFPLKELAAAAGVKLKSAKELVDKAVLKGGDGDVPALAHTPTHEGRKLPPVTLLEASVGPMWYSSRMVLDEWRRARRGGSTRFTPDHQPHGRVNGKVPLPPDGSVVDNLPPTGSPNRAVGDGPAVAVAVSSIQSPTQVLETSAGASTAGEVIQNHLDPEREVKILVECGRAKLEDPTRRNPIVARWLQGPATVAQITLALADARALGAKPHPYKLHAAYVDAIIERILGEDREARAEAEARVEETRRIIAESAGAAAVSGPKPADFDAKVAQAGREMRGDQAA